MWLLVFAGTASADAVRVRAEQALSKVPVRGDEAFLIGQARVLSGQPPLFLRPLGEYVKRRNEYPYSLEYALWSLKDAQVALKAPLFELATTRLSHPGQARALRASGPDYMPLYYRQARTVAAVMKTALECKPSFKPPEFGAAGYEYASTHQAAAVFLAYRRGCMGAEAFRQRAPLYLSRVYAEYLATRLDDLSDLQVERMAMLCLAGYCRKIPRADIERLGKAQARDGLWYLPDNVREIAGQPGHATALAYFVLSAYAHAP